jgi:hypothetical protein
MGYVSQSRGEFVMKGLALAVCLCFAAAEAQAAANCDHSKSWQCSGGGGAVGVAPAPDLGGPIVLAFGGVLLAARFLARRRQSTAP